MSGRSGDGQRRAVVIGGGFCGLAAAYELGRLGIRATVVEAEPFLGGLAGSFEAGGTRLEKFYHHWFTTDAHAMALVGELGLTTQVLTRPIRTGTYYAHNVFKLSSPLDVLRFSPLALPDRLRLGWLALRARHQRDWRSLEDRSAADWLRQAGGERVYQVVWEPLLRGKFGDLAEEVAAVWLWQKLKQRGATRKRGAEQLAYLRGGLATLADAVADAVVRQGGEVRTAAPARSLRVDAGRVTGVVTGDGDTIAADAVLATPALPITAALLAPHVDPEYASALRRIRYLANFCVVLELSRSLSDIYWLNVNDPGFPFVGVIEHTNFEPTDSYGGRHIAYLSKYLPVTDPLYQMADDDLLAFTLKHLRRMFPDFRDESLLAAHVWRADYAQPVVERGYRALIPATTTPLPNLFLATMAQVYPDDRGTNFAIAKGRAAARTLADALPG